MASPDPILRFETSFDPQTGLPVAVADGVVRITAPNRGPFTFTGTNSFIVGDDPLAVIDPGPKDDAHLRALLAAIRGRRVQAILLTHTHRDHCGLARQLRAATGAPLWFGGRHRRSRPRRKLELDFVAADSDWTLEPDRVLGDGEVAEFGSFRLMVLPTPGHCANHLCFGIEGTPLLLTGDHVMGWSSTLVPVPDGSMEDYLTSLEKLVSAPYATYLPAHGGPVADGPGHARALLQHRQQRNVQIIDAVAGGARNLGQLLRVIYPDLPAALRPAARMTLQAHLEYLAGRGEIALDWGLFGPKIARG